MCSHNTRAASDLDSVSLNKALHSLEDRWNQPGGDTAFHFMLEQVDHFCKHDDLCMFETYKVVVNRLERRANLPLAILVEEEMIAVAKRIGDVRAEANAYRNLDRFYYALGNERLAVVHLEKALRIYEQLNDQSAITHAQMSLLEYSLSYRKIEDVLPEMEALLTHATQQNDTPTIYYLHLRLLLHTQQAKQYDKMEDHIVALEQFPLSDPIQPKEYGIAIHATLGRADLLKIQKRILEAEVYYQKALKLCRAEPSRWLEIAILQSLSDLEWERGKVALSKSYLNEAQEKAEKLQFNDLLISTYERKARIAEAEGRFADALNFTKKQQRYNDKRKALNAGFNLESYDLQRDKENLVIEKRNQELELRLRNTQLRGTLVSAFLVLCVAILLFVSLRRQRKRKQELVARNALIQLQTEELKSLDVAKTRFFANVSHELRTPLTLMLGPVKSALNSGTLDKRNSTLLEMARQSGDELVKLITSLLDLTKLEHGKMMLKEKPEQIFPLLRRIISSFESYAEYVAIQLTFTYNGEKDLRLELDREKVEIILNNLLSNAFKFTGTHGKIDVSVEDQSNTLMISVRDTGKGISPIDLPHVFDRFYQSREHNAPTEGGTGIGLALCYELVSLMGGKIRAESNLGFGSTFYVEIPRKEVLGTKADTEPTIHEPFNSVPIHIPNYAVDVSASDIQTNQQVDGKTSLLVVEDNYSLRDYLNTILSPYYYVISTRNGQEALEYINNAKKDSPRGAPFPALILTDLMMPVMDGYQLLEELKGNNGTRHIPVIMLTARADARDKLKSLRIGVDDYLTKPFDEEELLVRIENLLHNRAERHRVAVEHTNDQDIPSTTLTSSDTAWLEGFETFVKKNLASDTLTVPVLAHHFTMSESSLLRQLKRLTGLSTVQYLQEMRLDEARLLLETEACDSISAVASRVGYNEVRSFSRIFKQRFGKSPSAYINS